MNDSLEKIIEEMRFSAQLESGDARLLLIAFASRLEALQADGVVVPRDIAEQCAKVKLADKFTEIVAMRLDVFGQRENGIWPPHTDLERWKRRYLGTPKDELPPYTVEMNIFKAEVDGFVAMLMSAIDELSEPAESETGDKTGRE